MTLSVEAQAWEQEKDGRLWLAIGNDFVRNLEDEVRDVLREKRK